MSDESKTSVIIHEKILNHLHFTIIVWELSTDIKCIYTNNKLNDVKVNTLFTDYLSSNLYLVDKYNLLFEKKTHQTIMRNNETIELFSLTDTIFYEIRTNIQKYYNYDLISYISSQVRSPLTTIIGSLNELLEMNVDNKTKTYLNEIESSSYDIITLVNDLTDLVNLGKNNVHLQMKTIDIKQRLPETIKSVFFKMIDDRTIKFMIDTSLPKFVFTDETRLSQILINILKYILKNTSTNSITIGMSLNDGKHNCPFEYFSGSDKLNILFTISDTKSTYSENQITSIEEILGLETKNVKSYHNCELNLLLSKYICNLLCGNIWIDVNSDNNITYYFNIVCYDAIIK